MYTEGDYIPGLGTVDTNHCGLPGLAGMDGLFYGVLQIQNHACIFQVQNHDCVFIDAMSGLRLSGVEVGRRLNDKSYDYENKASDCINWRKKNQPYGPYRKPKPCMLLRLWWFIKDIF